MFSERDPDQRRTYRCCATNCPVSAGIQNGQENICRFHFGTPMTEWNAVTQKLLAQLTIVKIVEYCLSGPRNPNWPARARAVLPPELHPVRREIQPGIERDEAEYPLLYAYRLSGFLGHQSRVELKAPMPKPAAPSSMVPISSALPEW